VHEKPTASRFRHTKPLKLLHLMIRVPLAGCFVQDAKAKGKKAISRTAAFKD
jgi:hypothetical protein